MPKSIEARTPPEGKRDASVGVLNNMTITRPLRIAQVATSPMSIHLLLTDQIRALEAAGHHVTAVCGAGPFLDEVNASGIRVCAIPMAREVEGVKDIGAVKRLRDLFQSERFDVVHTHTPKAGLLGPIAARLARVPTVVHTIHGLLFHDRMPRARRMMFWGMEKITAVAAHELLSQSMEDIDVAVRSRLCAPERIHYLGNGIDTECFTPMPNHIRDLTRQRMGYVASDFVVGVVGRVVYEKGFWELFEAIDIASARNRDLRCLIVGPFEADQSDAVDPEFARQLQARGLVKFAGWQSDMRPWYQAMDVFVLPSHREGIPRACMEAAASGQAVIASDIRGCREVVLDGKTGRLVPVRDPHALAEAILWAAQHKRELLRMGDAGRQHIHKNFNQRDVLQRLVAFYREIATHARARN